MEAEACGVLRRAEHLTPRQKSLVHREDRGRFWLRRISLSVPSVGSGAAARLHRSHEQDELLRSIVNGEWLFAAHELRCCFGDAGGGGGGCLRRCSLLRAACAHVHAGLFAGGSGAAMRSRGSPTLAPQWLARDLLPLTAAPSFLARQQDHSARHPPLRCGPRLRVGRCGAHRPPSRPRWSWA